jgi:hypothetical protein
LGIFLVFAIDYNSKTVTKKLETDFKESYNKKLKRIKFKIKTNLDFFKNTTLSLAKLINKNSSNKEQEDLLKSFLENFNGLFDLTLVSKNSFEIARLSKYSVLKEGRKKVYFNDEFYKFVLINDKPFVGNIRTYTITGEPLIDIAVPVKDKYTGKTWAILKATFSGKLNQDYIENESSADVGIGIYNATKKVNIMHYGVKIKDMNKLYDMQKKHIKDYISFYQMLQLPRENILLYMIIPEEKLTLRAEKLRKTYIFYIYGTIVILFVFFYVVLDILTSKLRKSTKELIQLSEKLAGSKIQDDNSKDEVEQLNIAIKHIKSALKKAREKDAMLAQQNKLSALGEMLGNIAHQWRQPLNVISLEKDILIEDYYQNELNDERIKEFEDNMNEMISYLSRTIDDFKNFFSPSKRKEKFDITNSLQRALNIVAASLKAIMFK